MNEGQIDFYFMPFSELELSEESPVIAVVFQDQRDLVIAQKFPEFELMRSRIDVIGKTTEDVQDHEAFVFVPLPRDEQLFIGGVAYIDHPWRKAKSLDFDSTRFHRKISERVLGMVKALRRHGYTKINILLPSRFHPENISNKQQKERLIRFVRIVTETIVYANNSLEDFKSRKLPRITEVVFTYFGGYVKKIDTFFQRAVGDGKDLGEILGYVRRLIELPPNHKTPLSFVEEALGVDLGNLKPNARKGWKRISGHRFSSRVRVDMLYGAREIRNFGFGLVAAVGQGSVHEPCFLKVHYKPKTGRQKGVKKVSLTGKGVTFDTGGIDIKLTDNYEKMHYDMAGAANVMGLIRLADETGLKVELIGLIPLVRNAVGSNAIDPFSVVTAYSGETVEIRNTDAEGRLILADAVAYSEKHIRPDCTISVATLCDMEDITTGILKVFTTTKPLEKKVRIAETHSTEPVMLWPGPEHLHIVDENLVGDHTDLVNDLDFGYHSVGLMFVYNFFKCSPACWIYVDISSVFGNDAPDYYAGPGFGTKFIWYLVRLFQ